MVTAVRERYVIVAYELQTYHSGAWKIDSMYDDRKLAMMEAQRASEAERYPAVRLVEENYDPDTQSSTSRVIFRASRIQSENQTALVRRQQVVDEIASVRQTLRSAARLGRTMRNAKRRQRQMVIWLAGIIIKGGAILLLGLGLLYGLKLISQLL